MPEPVVVVLISAIGGIVGGVIAAIARPWGQDYVNRKAHERAEESHRSADDRAEEQRLAAAAATRTETRTADRRQRLREIEVALAGVASSSFPSENVGRYRATRAAAAEINDPQLVEAIGRMHSSDIGDPEWNAAFGDANHRIGELLRGSRDT